MYEPASRGIQMSASPEEARLSTELSRQPGSAPSTRTWSEVNGHVLLYKRLYRDLACPALPYPAMAIQLYSAIHYTAIQRYTVYMLYVVRPDLVRRAGALLPVRLPVVAADDGAAHPLVLGDAAVHDVLQLEAEARAHDLVHVRRRPDRTRLPGRLRVGRWIHGRAE